MLGWFWLQRNSGVFLIEAQIREGLAFWTDPRHQTTDKNNTSFSSPHFNNNLNKNNHGLCSFSCSVCFSGVFWHGKKWVTTSQLLSFPGVWTKAWSRNQQTHHSQTDQDGAVGGGGIDERNETCQPSTAIDTTQNAPGRKIFPFVDKTHG